MDLVTEEERLRREIASGAGLEVVERLARLLEETRFLKAHLVLPDSWDTLLKSTVPGHAPMGPAKVIGDPAPRRDDFRQLEGRFEDGIRYVLILASDHGPYAGGYYAALDLYPADVDCDAIFQTDKLSSLPRSLEAKHAGKTYVLNLLRTMDDMAHIARNPDRRDRVDRRARRGDATVIARLIVEAVQAGSLAPEVVAFAALLDHELVTFTTRGERPVAKPSLQKAIQSAAASLGPVLTWTPADDKETQKRGYVLELYEQIPRDPVRSSSSFSRVQVEFDMFEDEHTPAALALGRAYAAATGGRQEDDALAGWWSIRTGAFAGDPLSIKALAFLRAESPPEYQAVLQGWNHLIERAGGRNPVPTWPTEEDKLLEALLAMVERAVRRG